MTTNPMDRMLDAVTWEQLPAPAEDADTYATHQGILTIDEFQFRCYVLNDGRRLLDAEDMQKFFGLWGE